MKTGPLLILFLVSLFFFSFRHYPAYEYKTVKIGDLTWMSENLSQTSFRDGTPITQARSEKEWEQLNQKQKPAWCYSGFNSKNAGYGLQYNFFAVKDTRGLAPKGWHVAGYNEWLSLLKLGPDDTGAQLKSKTGWIKDGNGTNSSGFNALPAGSKNIDLGEYGYWWTSSIDTNYLEGSYIFFLGYDMNYLDGRTYSWDAALSVRCVKDPVLK